MELTPLSFLIVCPLVFLAGVVDAIGGGGGLISLPAYLFAGVPATLAVGTNKLSSAAGTVVSTVRFCKHGRADLPLAIPGILAALVGAQLGAHLALLVDEAVFHVIMLVTLPIIAFYVLRKKDLEPDPASVPSRRAQMVIAAAASLAIGTYDGLYGPGTGTFLILVYTGLAKMDVLTASGNTKLVNLTSNLSALVVFLVNGTVLLPLGLVAAVFCIAGHYVGAGLALKNGSRFVRVVILIVVALLFVKILSGWLG